MTTRRIFIIIFAIYIFGFFAHAFLIKKTVYGDGIFYYSWLRSIVIDHDLDFRNEYAHYNVTQPISPISQISLIGNKYSLGPAILWSPAFLWIHSLIRGTGYELPYQLAVDASGVLITIFSLILLYRLLIKFIPQEISLAVILSIAFATNLFFYGSLDVVNSHALSFFAVTLFLTLLFNLSSRTTFDVARDLNWFLLGASLALISLIRIQDLIFGLLIVPVILEPRQRRSDRISKIIKFFTGFLLGFSPQLLAWQYLYGNLSSPYLINEGFNFLKPHVLEVLFSPTNGLFLWTPITLLAFAGLFIPNKIRIFVPIRYSLIIVILLQLYLVSSWSTWSQGASYSGRMFVSSLPILSFGLGKFYQWLSSYRFKLFHFLLIFILPLSIINFSLIFYFLLSH